MLNILLIGDGSILSTLAANMFENAGYPTQNIVDAHNTASTMAALSGAKLDMVALVRSSTGEKYISPEIMQTIKNRNVFTQIVIVSKDNDPEARRIAIDWDAIWVLNLDDSPEVIGRMLAKLEKKQSMLHMDWKKRQYIAFADYILGRSPLFPGEQESFQKELRCHESYQIALIRVLPKYTNGQRPKTGTISSRIFSILFSRLESLDDHIIGREGFDIIICFMGSRNEISSSKSSLNAFLWDMKVFSKTVYPVSCWICIGSLVESIDMLSQSYLSAKALMMDRFFCPRYSLAEVSNPLLNTTEESNPLYFSDTLHALSKAAEISDIQHIFVLLNQLKNNLSSLTNISGKDLFSIYKKLISSISRIVSHANPGNIPIPPELEYGTMLAEFERFCLLGDMFSCLEYFFITALNWIHDAESSSLPPVIIQAKEYIRTYYNMPLSLHEISEYVHMNDNYFSDFFSKNVGMTFKQFQTDLRIKHAKELLLDKHNSIEDIAEEIGYSDVKYFSRVFKRVTGKSPGTYRSQHPSVIP